jgi:hypothetical protein
MCAGPAQQLHRAQRRMSSMPWALGLRTLTSQRQTRLSSGAAPARALLLKAPEHTCAEAGSLCSATRAPAVASSRPSRLPVVQDAPFVGVAATNRATSADLADLASICGRGGSSPVSTTTRSRRSRNPPVVAWVQPQPVWNPQP